jgi:hypothetical protein
MANHKKVRPHLPNKILQGNLSQAEEFQNLVLRPVIKMQSELLIAHLTAKLNELMIVWPRLSPSEQREFLKALFSKNQVFKNEIVGMVIGQFSLEEYHLYTTMQRELARRITQIVLNRCIDILINSALEEQRG